METITKRGPRARAVWGLACLVGLSACSKDGPVGPNNSPPPPLSLTVAAGNAQTAPPGETLAAAPEVRVVDGSGAGQSGVSVSFQVLSGGGSVANPSATTDATGVASAGSWTLGSTTGTQQLRATVGDAGSVTFTATATSTPTAITATAGDGQTAPAQTAVPVAPRVRVTDAGGAPVEGVAVTFVVTGGGGAVNGAAPVTDADGHAAVGSWILGSTPGPNTLSASVAWSGVAGNPVTFTATATAGAPASIAASAGDGQTAPASTSVPIRPEVRVTDALGNGVAGVTVSFVVTSGGGNATGTTPTTSTDGRASVSSWTLGSTPGGNELTATVSGGGISGNPVVFTATGTSSGASGAFDIEIRYNPGSSPTSGQAAAFAQAEAKWESIIIGDLVNTTVNQPAGTCTSPTPISETIDDVIIYVTLEAIDGPGGTLGSAGPCLVRSGSLLPLAGQMRFDIADLAMLETQGRLDEVVGHEMGHVLGVGTLWSSLGFLVDPSMSGGTDPHFDGPLAIAAFNGIGGGGYSGPKVPVEATGGPGTADGHWRESVFASELMTGWVNVGANPLSEVTVRSMADLGYSVDPAQADGYTLPGSSLIVPGPGTEPQPLQLVDDVWRVPMPIITPSGRLAGLITH